MDEKQWVESFGYVFAERPDGKWVCADPNDDADGFSVTCDTLNECVQESADWLDSCIDPDIHGIPPRPAIRGSETSTGVAQ